jgi:hypothetical protein
MWTHTYGWLESLPYLFQCSIAMQRIIILLSGLLLTLPVFSQKKPNPKIGKNETELNLSMSWDRGNRGNFDERTLFGTEAIYRVSWRNFTKLGGGILLATDNRRYLYGNVKFYGAVFADITQFIGKRQLWSINGRVGHGLYKEKYEFEDSTTKGFLKLTAGMYYSIGPAYRIIVSKKILVTASVHIIFRNLRRTFAEDHYSPPSTSRDESIEHYHGVGLRFGVLF